MSSKKKTTETSSSNTATNSTVTPNVPTWYSDPTQQLAGSLGTMFGNAGQYTPQISDLQNQAVAGAQNLTSSPYYNQAGATLNNVGDVAPSSVLDNLSSYYNPFQSQITDPVMAAYDKQAGITTAANAANAAKTGAFGGSRYGVEQAQSLADLAQGRASTQGTLLQNMYTQAAGMSEADAARRQQAAIDNQQTGLAKGTALANLGSAQGADARANVAEQAQVGGAQTDTQNAIRQYPIQYQQQMEQLLAGLNPALFTGSTSAGTGSSSGTKTTTESDQPGLLQALGTAGAIASLFTPMAPFSAATAMGSLGGIGAAGAGMFGKLAG
jgi:hypothetical protein